MWLCFISWQNHWFVIVVCHKSTKIYSAFLQRNMLITSLTTVWNCWHGHRHCESSAGDIYGEGCYDRVSATMLGKQHTYLPGHAAKKSARIRRAWACLIAISGRKKVFAKCIKVSGFVSNQSRAGSISLVLMLLTSREKWIKLVLDVKTYFIPVLPNNQDWWDSSCELSQEIHLI